MLPLFFGPADRQLFGILHLPGLAGTPRCGVVFCQPLAHEFYTSHRCSGQLVGALADAGLAVLRFDYFGTGDSPGDWEEASVARWLDDIGCAAAELRRRGCEHLCLVGLRFGATLAVLFAAERGPVDALVLVEPVADGENYLRELESLHSQTMAGTPGPHNAPPQELLGFEFDECLRREIGRINLRADRGSLCRDVLLFGSAGAPGDGLRTALEAVSGRRDFESASVPPFWLDIRGHPLLPAQIPRRMASWIESVCH